MENAVEIEFASDRAGAGFASFKYKHDGAALLSAGRRKWFWWSLAVALIASVAFFPFGLLLWIVPMVVRFLAPRRLELGMRYLICGADIVYYGNVSRVDMEAGAGRLTLLSADGRRFVLDRGRFPTAARKAHKIAANQQAKFDKVSSKVIERVRASAPNAAIVRK